MLSLIKDPAKNPTGNFSYFFVKLEITLTNGNSSIVMRGLPGIKLLFSKITSAQNQGSEAVHCESL